MPFLPTILFLLVGCVPTAVAADRNLGGGDGGKAFWRGVTVSCFRWGPGEWDGPWMPGTLNDLGLMGVNAVAIHPYAGIAGDGTVTYRPGPVGPATSTPLRLARERGMTTLLKPHLAYWRSPFAWRGDITFDAEERWERFFRGYTAFILDQARLAEAERATVFAVGTELHKTLHREAEWRDIISQVRAVYSGKLTYAANWDVYQDVPFWDALDLVGVQSYFPLSEADEPTDLELEAGWAEVLVKLHHYSEAVGKPILLTELGYAKSTATAKHPWKDDHVGEPDAAAALKLRCMRIALRAIETEPAIVGVFLWKWFPADPLLQLEHEFILQYDAMRDVIRGAWVEPSR